MKPSPSGFVDINVLRVLCVGANQDGTRIGVGHEDGFVVYSMLHLAQQHRRMVQGAVVIGCDSGGGIGGPRLHADAAESTGGRASDGGTEGDSMQLLEDFRYPKEEDRRGSASGGSSGEREPSSESMAFRCSSPSDDEAAGWCGVGAIALLGDTRIVAVAGGGLRPICPVDQVQVLDRNSFGQKQVIRTIQLGAPVRRVVMVGARLIVSLTATTLAIHTFTGQSLFESPAAGGDLHSAPMPLATCHFSSTLAFAASEKRVQLVNFQNDLHIVPVLPAPIEVHMNPITAIALSPEGSLFATSSERGTLIRVWRAADGSQVSEVRNSSTASVIRQLCFIGTSHIFCVSSDRVKVFFAHGQPPASQPWVGAPQALAGNAQLGYLKALSILSTYFASQWAMCECSIPQTFLPSCLAVPDSVALGSARSSCQSSIGNDSVCALPPPSAAAASSSSTVVAAAVSTYATTTAIASSVTGWVSGFWQRSPATPVPVTAAATAASASTVMPPPLRSTNTSVAALGLPRGGYYAPRTLDDAVLLRWECSASMAAGGPSGAAAAAAGGPSLKDLLVISGEGTVMRIAFDPVKGTVATMGVLQAAQRGT